MTSEVNTLINLKNSSNIFYSQGPQVKTDTDMFPYQRNYRGDHSSHVPLIYSRQAGWQQRHDMCYNKPKTIDTREYYPNHCFQSAPSTVYPCYPEYLRKYADKEQLDIQLFNKNVLEFR